jgi:hypothetical protein
LSAQDAFKSDIVLKVRAPTDKELPLFKDNATLISFLYPKQNQDLVEKLATHNLNAFAMDMIPLEIFIDRWLQDKISDYQSFPLFFKLRQSNGNMG